LLLAEGAELVLEFFEIFPRGGNKKSKSFANVSNDGISFTLISRRVLDDGVCVGVVFMVVVSYLSTLLSCIFVRIVRRQISWVGKGEAISN